MAKTEPGRLWPYTPGEWRFNGRVFPGVHPRLKTAKRPHGVVLHFNPGILINLLRYPPTWALIAGGWHIPTSGGLLLMKSAMKKTHILLWAEANAASSRYASGVVPIIRRMLYHRADGVAIPGQIAEHTITNTWNIQGLKTLHLPNLVEEEKFLFGAANARHDRSRIYAEYNIPETNRVLFWSARLNDDAKGFLNFFKAVEKVISDDLTFLIAGDGPDRSKIEQWLQTRPHIDARLLGHISQSELIRLQGAAHVAMLPSLHDPNPLSVIEAMWSGLAILSSVRCGNHPETVVPGRNGWVVDPAQPASIRQAMQEICACSDEDLARMGQESLILARERFSSGAAARRFADELEQKFPPLT